MGVWSILADDSTSGFDLASEAGAEERMEGFLGFHLRAAIDVHRTLWSYIARPDRLGLFRFPHVLSTNPLSLYAIHFNAVLLHQVRGRNTGIEKLPTMRQGASTKGLNQAASTFRTVFVLSSSLAAICRIL